MFNSTALDVVISLVFIYLLYSLLITIIGEMVSNWLGIRARVLRKAIEKMLNDGYLDRVEGRFGKIKHFLNDYFLQENASFPKSFAGNFYNQPSIKYLTKGHDKKRRSFSQTKPSYFSGKNFANTVAQMFRNKGNGLTEIEKIKFSFQYNTLHIQTETLKQFENMLHDSGHDIEQFKENLEKWFDETMDRANGWYKKKLQLILFWLGFVVAAFFNVDTIKIVSTLSSDKEALKQTVQLAIASADTTSSVSRAIRITQGKEHSDTLLNKAFADVDAQQKKTSEILGLGWKDVNSETYTVPFIGLEFGYYNQFNPFRKEFWGLVITALALSLGAPFWFDLLKKLVALRSSGVKPEEKEADQNVETITPKNPEATHISEPVIAPVLTDGEKLLAKFTEELKNVPGFIGIGLEPLNNNLNGLLSVHVNSASVQKLLTNIHGLSQKLENGFSLPVKYDVQQPNMIHAAEFGGEISNRTLNNGHGTLSCFLQKKGSDKIYLLSCWHVLKDNNNWSTAPISKEIVNTKMNTIATITEGCLTESIDIGIAECIDSSIVNDTGAEIKTQFRFITAYDSLINTEVVLYGKVCKFQKAQIFHHQINTSINYSNQERLMYDLFSISIINLEKNTYTSPTQPGDSGAIVIDSNTNAPLGIIIGGNNEFSYGVKFSKVFSPDSLYNNYSFKI